MRRIGANGLIGHGSGRGYQRRRYSRRPQDGRDRMATGRVYMSSGPESPRRAVRPGDIRPRSSADLLPEVYNELRRLARVRLRRESLP